MSLISVEPTFLVTISITDPTGAATRQTAEIPTRLLLSSKMPDGFLHSGDFDRLFTAIVAAFVYEGKSE
jgi:hypothetical protein